MVNLGQIFDAMSADLKPALPESLNGAESTRFRNALKKNVVSFRYRKKDGTTRKARGTLQKDVLPDYGENRRPRHNQNGFVYWDVDKGGFRSFLRANFIDYENPKKDTEGMKKTYTKKQIREAIAYWKKQLAKGNYRKVNEVKNNNLFDAQEFLLELKDRMTADRDLENMFGDAYQRLDPDWDGDMNNDDYLDWEFDFLSQATERTEQNGGSFDFAFADMRAALQRIIDTGHDDYIQ